MESPTPQKSNTAGSRQARATLWIIYAFLLMGEILFCVVMSQIMNSNAPRPQPNMFLILTSGVLLAGIPIAFLVHRSMIRKAQAAAFPNSLHNFTSAYITFWGCCEMAAFFALVTALINRSFYPTIIFFAVALACQAAMFPRPRLLQPASDTFGGDLLQR
jgi:hypothetical protein